eukprot:TRINITY_DN58130_c0_g1_i1.p1 TRINITY_DN58130_c0_g1~~TRINITY_DN58130_c0_g1_i1.p1  ORF type:complete len:347 (+),score=55.37 TRINITY_DN58130_c0_g1_i1:55-1095(+)
MEALIQRLCRENPTVPEDDIRQFVRLRLQQQQDREYPLTFRARLDADKADDYTPGDAVTLRTRCHCGQCDFKAVARGIGGKPPAAIRCYCSACRHFHTSAFGAFVSVDGKPEDWGLDGKARRCRDMCSALGTLDRLICSKCFVKLAVLPLEGAHAGRALLSLGSVDDECIPAGLALGWQVDFEVWEAQSGSSWWTAKPSNCEEPRRSTLLRGSCTCGACTFEAQLLPGEAQHCYCKLCRRMSGSVAQTWLPASNEQFSWTKSEALSLMRTTGHGQRHVCTRCGVVLTIVYDSQPDCTWPVAGALDDAGFPRDDEGSWYRVIHICCSNLQPWYQLPDDGLPRLKFAG